MKKIWLGILISTFILFGVDLVSAALSGDEGLTISPPLREITLTPGSSSKQVVRITNPTANLVELYPKVMDFGAKGETGEPGFMEAEEGSGRYSLANWIKISQSKIALTPEQIVEFEYVIDVPRDAEPGGHYGVIFFATEPPEVSGRSSNVALSSMVGSLVLVRVPGEVVESARIEEFNTDKWLYLSNKVSILTRINNLGNVHFKPTGSIKIKDLFGRNADTVIFNEQKGNVLPESTRRFENQWNPKKILIGPYTASLDLVYGEQRVSLTDSITFWMIPWWLIAIICAILTVIIFLAIRGSLNKKEKGNK